MNDREIPNCDMLGCEKMFGTANFAAAHRADKLRASQRAKHIKCSIRRQARKLATGLAALAPGH